ncbi:hypothetical protein, partial [Mesorhizobium sp. M8A.F.Ca.ET.181.01.1.1]|uniref:hypothetical protein n=1 Tax=Mesorhizobium sp. M8A.F.Ca.ET.181.01.1.1 TaxID=2563963 RepID=UPI001AEEBA63
RLLGLLTATRRCGDGAESHMHARASFPCVCDTRRSPGDVPCPHVDIGFHSFIDKRGLTRRVGENQPKPSISL